MSLKLENLSIVCLIVDTFSYFHQVDDASWKNPLFQESKDEDEGKSSFSSRIDCLGSIPSPGVHNQFLNSPHEDPNFKSTRVAGGQYLNLDSSVPLWRKPANEEHHADDLWMNGGYSNSALSPIHRSPLAPMGHGPVTIYPPGIHRVSIPEIPFVTLPNGEDFPLSDRNFSGNNQNFINDSFTGSYSHVPSDVNQNFVEPFYDYSLMASNQTSGWIMPQRMQTSTSISEQELVSGRKTRGSAICKFFAQGHCARGESCTFAHVTATKGSGMVGARSRIPLAKPPASTRKFPIKTRVIAEVEPVIDYSSKIAAISTVADLVGCVYILAKDQHGCRLLQRFVDEDPDAFDIIFSEAFERINELMTDPFGNYLCQKLIDSCGNDRRMQIVSKVSEDLVAISLNIHGTRVVQKLVEVIDTPDEIEILVESLRQSVVTLTKDLNGNHVIQRCLHHLPSPDNQFIYDSIAAHCVSVATHKHGCCVLQRCIDYASEDQKELLISVIIENVLELVQDAFGNYVVQYVLDLGEPAVSRMMMEQMLGNITNLAVQKFSSNVVEKCLQIADSDIRDLIIDEICNQDKLPRLLHDPYANYVIQKALSVSPSDRFTMLVETLKPHVAALRSTAFGKRIQNKIVKRFPVLSTEPSA